MLTIWSPGLRPALFRGLSGDEGGDLHGAVLHLGNEAEGEGIELVGRGRGGDDFEIGVDALAVVQVGEGHAAVEVECGLVEDVVPVGILDAVEADDGVAGLDAGGSDRGIRARCSR